MEFARVVRSIMSTKQCTQQALLRTANCSFSLHSRFVKLTKQVKTSYSAIEKEKQDCTREEEWEEQSGFVRAGNFVLSHFISTAFVKTGLIGEKGLFTSTDGRKCLFSLPLSDSSVLVGPLTALGAFLSALKPPTLDPKAYVVCVCVCPIEETFTTDFISQKHVQICKTSYQCRPTSLRVVHSCSTSTSQRRSSDWTRLRVLLI